MSSDIFTSFDNTRTVDEAACGCLAIMKIAILVLLTLRAGDCSYDISDKILFPNLPNAAPRSENKICREESQAYIENLNNLTLWAHTMWDATQKSTSGVLQGNLFHFGSWDECMKVNGPFKTQYCFATIKASVSDEYEPEDQFSLYYSAMDNVLQRLYKTEDESKQTRHIVHIGWCTPASCTSIDLEKSLQQYFSKLEHPFYSHNVTYTPSVNQHTCQREQDLQSMDSVDVGFCILVAILILLVIAGTFYDARAEVENEKNEKQPKTSLLHNLCVAFSAKRTFLELSRSDDSNPNLKTLNGVRTFSIMMIIMDHRFGTYISGPMENFDYIEKQYRSAAACFLFHGDLFVDTFFILSGILVTYGLMTQFSKRMVNPGYIILLRYVRLTPLYAFVLFFWGSMLAHIGSGPFWKFVVPPEVADCRKNWWSNLLYISNFIDEDHMCMVHSWYLPCDFHYFIIAIFVVMLLNKNKKMGLGLLTLLFLISLVIPFVITILYLRPALLHFFPIFLAAPKGNIDFQLTYIKSYTRASTYFLGMFAGYIFYKLKEKEFQFSKVRSHALTITSVILLFAGMASGAVFYNPYHKYNVYEAGAYAALHRAVWGLGTLGLIFVSTHGHAKFLYNVLSWSPWTPLSKLVYGAYLTHMLFQLRGVGIAISPRHFTYFDAISMALSDIVLSFALSLLLYIMIENPFRKIIKHLLMPPRNIRKEEDYGANREVTRETSVASCDSRL